MTAPQLTTKNIVVFLFFLLMVSCSKKEKITPTPIPPVVVGAKGTMEISSSTVIGYQILNIKVKDLVLDKSEYEMEIGTKKVKAIRNMDNSLDLMVPGDLANGKYVVKAAFAINTLDLNVTAPPVLMNPEKTFKDFVGSTDIATITTEMGLTTPPPYLVQAKQKLEEGLAKFNALSTADKQIAAQILAANSKTLNELTDLLDQEVALGANRIQNKQGKSIKNLPTCGVECYLGHTARILLAAALLSSTSVAAPIIATVVALDFLASIITGKSSILMAKVKNAALEALEWAYCPQIKYAIGIIDAGFNTGMTNMDVKLEMIVKGEPFNFKLTPVYRTMLRSDATIPTMPYAASFVEAYDKAKSNYDRHFANEMGPFPNFVVKEEKIDAKLLADWEIKIIANNNVTVSAPEGSPQNFNVKFDSRLQEDQEFQFNINFKGQTETVSEKVNAILVEQPAYKMELLSGNNQTGESNEKVGELRVVVKNKSGKTMKGVKVHWTVVSGGGTLTQNPLVPNIESITDDDGIAKAEWTLGFAGEQTVQAAVKKRDGTDVIGSPFIFTASIAYPDKIQTFSGDNQTGEAGKKLPQLLRVKVLDEKGLPLYRARIKWVALHGGGKMNLNETFTDKNGIAEAELTAGTELHQLVQATTVKKDGTVIQANFTVTLANLIGKWKVEGEKYRYYNSGGTLLYEYEDDEFGDLDFGKDGSATFVYDRDVIPGSYVLDLKNGFLTLSTGDPDDERLNSKFKISNQLANSLTITSDKIAKTGSYLPSGTKDPIPFPPGSYQIAELKLRRL